MPAVHDRATVDRHKVALAQGPRSRYSVDHLVVDADTQAAGEAVVPKKRGRRAPASDVLLGGPVKVTGAHPIVCLAAHELQRLGHHHPRHPHLANLIGGLDVEALTTEHRVPSALEGREDRLDAAGDLI